MERNRHSLAPQPSDSTPRSGNRLTRLVGRSLLKLLGWRIVGTVPNCKQLVICGAPHTTNWDFVLAMLAVLSLGVKFSYLMKREAFIWPLKGLFIRLGGIPINRKASADTVAQIVAWFKRHEQVWLAITPEGTRTKVEKWKTGFLRIAYEAQVPILLVAWHYPSKTLFLDSLWQASGDHLNDADAMREYINQKFTGGRPENQ